MYLLFYSILLFWAYFNVFYSILLCFILIYCAYGQFSFDNVLLYYKLYLVLQDKFLLYCALLCCGLFVIYLSYSSMYCFIQYSSLLHCSILLFYSLLHIILLNSSVCYSIVYNSTVVCFTLL